MKSYYIMIVFCFFSFFLKAQTHTVNIYCTIDPIGRINYYTLKKTLPDSVAVKVLIAPRKELNIKDNYQVLLYMTANGWKLVNAFSESSSTMLYYQLSRDILLDDASYTIFTEKLKTK